MNLSCIKGIYNSLHWLPGVHNVIIRMNSFTWENSIIFFSWLDKSRRRWNLSCKILFTLIWPPDCIFLNKISKMQVVSTVQNVRGTRAVRPLAVGQPKRAPLFVGLAVCCLLINLIENNFKKLIPSYVCRYPIMLLYSKHLDMCSQARLSRGQQQRTSRPPLVSMDQEKMFLQLISTNWQTLSGMYNGYGAVSELNRPKQSRAFILHAHSLTFIL